MVAAKWRPRLRRRRTVWNAIIDRQPALIARWLLMVAEGDAVRFLGTLSEVKAGGDQTGNRLAAMEFTLPPGFMTPPHIHHMEEEGLYVLESAVVGFCGERSWRGTPGPGAAAVPPRQLRALGRGGGRAGARAARAATRGAGRRQAAGGGQVRPGDSGAAGAVAGVRASRSLTGRCRRPALYHHSRRSRRGP